jgi:hypothetical protein
VHPARFAGRIPIVSIVNEICRFGSVIFHRAFSASRARARISSNPPGTRARP